MSRILLVDDDAAFRTMLHKTLVRAGHSVEDAENGKMALERYCPTTIDLVITDLVMPEKEGMETILALRRMNRAVRIIAISGGGRGAATGYLQIAQSFGAKETLAKPFSPQEMLDAIERVIQTPA